MTSSQITKLLKFLNSMSDQELYEAGKLVTHLVGIRHAQRVMQGREVRPGKRGRKWKTVERKGRPISE